MLSRRAPWRARALAAVACGALLGLPTGEPQARRASKVDAASGYALELNLCERLVSLPPSRGYFDDLLGYGYGSTQSEPYVAFELGVQVSSRILPWLQLGGGVNYALTSLSARRGGGSIGIHVFELDVLRARPMLLHGGLFAAFELSLGLQLPLTVLRGQAEAHAPALLIRPRVMLGGGGRVRAGGMVGYSLAVAFGEPAHHAPVALSGFSFGPWLAIDLD